jgi:hypothetical protein
MQFADEDQPKVLESNVGKDNGESVEAIRRLYRDLGIHAVSHWQPTFSTSQKGKVECLASPWNQPGVTLAPMGIGQPEEGRAFENIAISYQKVNFVVQLS